MQAVIRTVEELLVNAGFTAAEVPIVAAAVRVSPDALFDSSIKANVQRFLNENRNPAFGTVIDKLEKAFGLKPESKEATTLAGEFTKPKVPSAKITGELIKLLEQSSYKHYDLHPEDSLLKFELTKDDHVPPELYASLESLLRAYELIKDDELDRNAILTLQLEYFTKQRQGQDVSNLKFAYIITLIKQIAVFKATADLMRDRVKQELLETPIKNNPKLMESVASSAVDVVLKTAARELPNVPEVEDVGLKSGLALEAALRQAYDIKPSDDFYQSIIDKNIEMKRVAKGLSSFGTVSPAVYYAAKDARIGPKSTDTLEQFSREFNVLSAFGAIVPEEYYETKPQAAKDKEKQTVENLQKQKALTELKQKYGEGGFNKAISMMKAPLAGAGMPFAKAGEMLKKMPEVANYGLPSPVKNTSTGAVPINTAKDLMSSLGRYSAKPGDGKPFKPFYDGTQKLSGALPVDAQAAMAGAVSRGLASGHSTPENLRSYAEALTPRPALGTDSLMSLGFPVGGGVNAPANALMPVNVVSNPNGRIAAALAREGMRPELIHQVMDRVGRHGGVSLFPPASADMRGVRKALGYTPAEMPDSMLRRVVGAGGDGYANRARNVARDSVAPQATIDNPAYRRMLAQYMAQQQAKQRGFGGGVGAASGAPSSLKEAYARQNAEYLMAMKQRRMAMTQALIDQEKAKQQGRGVIPSDDSLAYQAEKFVRMRVDEITGFPAAAGTAMIKAAQDRLLKPLFPDAEGAEFSFDNLGLGTAGRVVKAQFSDEARQAAVAKKDAELAELAGGDQERLKMLRGMVFSLRRERYIRAREGGVYPIGDVIPARYEDVIKFSKELKRFAGAMRSSLGTSGVLRLTEVLHAERQLISRRSTYGEGLSISKLGLGSAGTVVAKLLELDENAVLTPVQYEEVLLRVDNIAGALDQGVCSRVTDINNIPFGPSIRNAISMSGVLMPRDAFELYDFLGKLRESASQRRLYRLTEVDVNQALQLLDTAAGAASNLTVEETLNADRVLGPVISAANRMVETGEKYQRFTVSFQGLIHSVLSLKDTVVMTLEGQPIEAIQNMWRTLGAIGSVTNSTLLKQASKSFGGVLGWMKDIKDVFESPSDAVKGITEKKAQQWFIGKFWDGVKLVWNNTLKPVLASAVKRAGTWLLRKGIIDIGAAAGFFGLSSAEIGAATGLLAGGSAAGTTVVVTATTTAAATTAAAAPAGLGAASGFLSGLISAAGALNPVVLIGIVLAVLLLVCCCCVVLLSSGLFSGIGVTMQQTTTDYGSGQAYAEAHMVVSKTIPPDGLRRVNPSDPASPVNGTTYEVTLEYDGQFDSDFEITSITDQLTGFASEHETTASPFVQVPTVYITRGTELSELSISQNGSNLTVFSIIEAEPVQHSKFLDFKTTIQLSFDYTGGLDTLLDPSTGEQSLCNNISFGIRYVATGEEQTVSDRVCISPEGGIIDTSTCPLVAQRDRAVCSQRAYCGRSHSGTNATDVRLSLQTGKDYSNSNVRNELNLQPDDLLIRTPVDGEVVYIEDNEICPWDCGSPGFVSGLPNGDVVSIEGSDGLRYVFVHSRRDARLYVGMPVKAGEVIGSWETELSTNSCCWGSGPHIHLEINGLATGEFAEDKLREGLACEIGECPTCERVYK